MYRQVRTALALASVAALAMRPGVTEEQAALFIGSLPDGAGHYEGNRKAFKRGQRSERAASRKRQNRRLHPRAQA